MAEKKIQPKTAKTDSKSAGARKATTKTSASAIKARRIHSKKVR